MIDLADRLRGVLWIGGAPCSGKTSITGALAHKYHLDLYDLDAEYMRDPRFQDVPAVRSWVAQTMDERWVDQSVSDLLERSTACWSERFPLSVEQLLTRSPSRVLVVEGPGALPWLVAPLLRDPRAALFLLPGAEFRDRVVAEREARGISPVRYDRTRDPDRARANHRERDLLLCERIISSCEALGLRWIRIDRSLDRGAATALAEEQFAPYLPRPSS